VVININVRPQHSVPVWRTNSGSNPIVTEYVSPHIGTMQIHWFCVCECVQSFYHSLLFGHLSDLAFEWSRAHTAWFCIPINASLIVTGLTQTSSTWQ